jgi:predicted small metal-binding protein
MKQFSCGDVVPGCKASFQGASEDEILGQVAKHATVDHGMTDIPASLVAQVRANIQTVPAA